MVASQDTSSPSIVIFGGTGTQGGSVLTHLLRSDKPYRLRVVTRDPSKPNAKEIASKGVEVVQAEMGKKDELDKAIKYQDYVFAVTNFWEHGGKKELEDGKLLMDSVKDVSPSVKRVFWSGLEDVTAGSKGKYTHVKHFDYKAQILEYGRKEKGLPIVNVQAGEYMENHLTMLAPRKQEDGSFALVLPTPSSTKFSLIHSGRDYGAFVRGALESGMEAGGEVLACSEEITGDDMVKQWSEVTGQKISFYSADPAQFKAQAGEELTEMMQWFGDFGYFGGKDISPSLKLLPAGESVHTWKDFVKANDWSKIFA